MNQGIPDLNLLNTLKVLLEERHVTSAAKRLCVTQPAISKRLSQLRELFHDPLLVRVGNVLEPTSLALSLEPRLSQLFDQAGSIIHSGNFDPLSSPLVISLATTSFSAQALVPPILTKLMAECPGLRITVRTWQRFRPMELLMGEVHVAKCHLLEDELPPHFHALPLAERHPVCMMRGEHPLAGEELTMEKYLAARHISDLFDPDCPNWLENALTSMGYARDIAVYYPSVRGALLMVAETDLILSTCKLVADTWGPDLGLVVKPMPINFVHSRDYLLWHERSNSDPGQTWFRERFTFHYHQIRSSMSS